MSDFSLPDDKALCERFLGDGFVIAPSEDRAALDRMRSCIVGLASEFLKIETPKDPGQFLNRIADVIPAGKLNELRLHVIDGINKADWFRRAYFDTARSLVERIVGNELCMQRRVNLSVQLPHDKSSLLPVHADVWSGDSPFEIVLWIPMVDCFRTKSMYLLPPKETADFDRNFRSRVGGSAEDIYSSMQDDVRWMEVPYGSVLLFNQNLPHGNRLNLEPEARWTMNCRFKAVFTPYEDKKLGEFFEPITLRPATRAALAYRPPEKFEE
ncbi:sporadic carbohydrate cluster 2OG-Fe(II) oxygenase [Dongia sp.]|uniref:sporadic carbohydrate cluster 2OG-Fe(II) oxygenase n=1 Tax=Dongia sp. TaxID=1977262 RepID=UPI0035B08266